jgi:hypothetical protein
MVHEAMITALRNLAILSDFVLERPDELEPIAERIIAVETAHALEVVVPSHLAAGVLDAVGKLVDA